VTFSDSSDMASSSLREDFLWGASTSLHRIEGNNLNSDWWRLEQAMAGFMEPSGDACDSYHRYDQAIDHFTRYVEQAAAILDGVRWVCTINEPNILSMMTRMTAAVGERGGEALTAGALPAPDEAVGRRIAYTTEALRHLYAAVEDGVDVHGYPHWSAIDNYEWGHWAPAFGLIAVDRETFERTPEPSLAWLGRVARSGGVLDPA
jgi:beta-glucosidase/6-phospho-beta-glucosidase/beta-galactosidase